MAYFYKITTQKYIFDSTDVKIFPSAYRETTIDPEARLHTEFNLSHIGGNLPVANSKNFNSVNSYIISNEVINAENKLYLIKFIIGGYYFEVKYDLNDFNSSTDDWSSTKFGKPTKKDDAIYLYIDTVSAPLINEPGSNVNTKILKSYVSSIATGAILDYKPADESRYYFSGLLISKLDESVSFTARLELFHCYSSSNRVWEICEQSKLPHIENGQGKYSTIIGNNSKAEATGENSIAMSPGSANAAKAKGLGSIAIGSSSEAQKTGSIAIGHHTTAKENYSTAIGETTVAAKANQFVFGQYNVEDNTKIEVVGGGTNSTPKNIRTLDESGNEILAGHLTMSGIETDSTTTNLAATIDTNGKILKRDLTVSSAAATNQTGASFTYVDTLTEDASGRITDTRKTTTISDGVAKTTSGDNANAGQGTFHINNTNIKVRDMGTTDSPTFANITDTGLTGSQFVLTDENKQLISSNNATDLSVGHVNTTTNNSKILHPIGTENTNNTNADTLYANSNISFTGSAIKIAKTLETDNDDVIKDTTVELTGATADNYKLVHKVNTKETIAEFPDGSIALNNPENITLGGPSSYAEGYNTVTGGDYESNTLTTGSIVAAGEEDENNFIHGIYAHAEGNATIAQGAVSHAEGEKTFAKGKRSHAEGYATVTKGSNAHAEGYSTLAAKDNAHAEGNMAHATMEDSHAEGSKTIASGTAAHAEGYDTRAAGKYTHSEGHQTTAEGNYSHAEGKSTLQGNDQTAGLQLQSVDSYTATECIDFYAAQTSGTVQLTAEYLKNSYLVYVDNADNAEIVRVVSAQDYESGWRIKIDRPFRNRYNNVSSDGKALFSVYVLNIGIHTKEVYGYYGQQVYPYFNVELSNYNGYGPTDAINHFTGSRGNATHTEGITTTAWLEAAHAEGYNSVALGKAAHAEGSYTLAKDDYAHSEGIRAAAEGLASHAEGYNTKAIGKDAHAEGAITTASGLDSHAEGNGTLASGNFSHAEGFKTIASGSAQHVFGQLNSEDTSKVEIVGGGEEHYDSGWIVNRKNIRTLDWEGNEWLAGNLTVGGTLNTTGDITVGANGNGVINGRAIKSSFSSSESSTQTITSNGETISIDIHDIAPDTTVIPKVLLVRLELRPKPGQASAWREHLYSGNLDDSIYTFLYVPMSWEGPYIGATSYNVQTVAFPTLGSFAYNTIFAFWTRKVSGRRTVYVHIDLGPTETTFNDLGWSQIKVACTAII